MYKYTLIFMFAALALHAQTKKPASKAKVAKPDSVVATKVDTTDPVEEDLKLNRKFGVYTRKPRKPDNRMKLCINLVSQQAMLNLCINDSVCKYPENSKVLFEKASGDSTYVLVFVDAFTKVNDNPGCDAGHETKLVFVRWNTRTNKATWKQRIVSSCIKAVTNMTKEPITNWDGVSTLVVNYHRGDDFIELRFDPQKYLLGFQSPNDSGAGN